MLEIIFWIPLSFSLPRVKIWMLFLLPDGPWLYLGHRLPQCFFVGYLWLVPKVAPRSRESFCNILHSIAGQKSCSKLKPAKNWDIIFIISWNILNIQKLFLETRTFLKQQLEKTHFSSIKRTGADGAEMSTTDLALCVSIARKVVMASINLDTEPKCHTDRLGISTGFSSSLGWAWDKSNGQSNFTHPVW